jgi:hypothetical protein
MCNVSWQTVRKKETAVEEKKEGLGSHNIITKHLSKELEHLNTME